jgi:ABC-type transport system involved in cytochrome bd biosynthesis fused ATPase/permease subunit
MYYQQKPDPVAAFISGVAQVTIGVFIGGLLAAFAFKTIVTWEAKQAMKDAAKEIRRAAQDLKMAPRSTE